MAVGVAAAKGIGGFFGGVWKVIAAVFGLFFLKWRITISIFLLVIILGNAGYQSYQEKSYKPLIFKAGGIILSADEELSNKIDLIEANDWRLPSNMIKEGENEQGFWSSLKSIFSKVTFIFEILSAGWFVYIMGFLWFLVFRLHNESEKFWNILFAVGIMVFLHMSYSLSMLYLDYDCGIEGAECLDYDNRIERISVALIPLKGTYKVIYHTFFTGNLVKNTFLMTALPSEISPLNSSLNSSDNSSLLLDLSLS